MMLFGHELSDKALSFMAAYEQELDKEIRFAALPAHYPQWSALDQADGFQIIGIQPVMPDAAFEATLCHEIYHAYQFACGFPTVISNDKNKKDVVLYTEHLQGNVLDLSADNTIREYGFDDSFIMNKRYKNLKSLSISNFAACREPFDRDLLAVDLILDFHSITENQKSLILQKLEAELPDVYKQYLIYQRRIDRYGYQTPIGCFKIFGFIINSMELWPYCHILYQDEEIHTLEHFMKVSAADPQGSA